MLPQGGQANMMSRQGSGRQIPGSFPNPRFPQSRYANYPQPNIMPIYTQDPDSQYRFPPPPITPPEPPVDPNANRPPWWPNPPQPPEATG